MSKKIIYRSLALFFIGIAGLILYDISNMDIEELILCSANEGGIRTPSSFCKYYMLHYRTSEDDIAKLTEGAGLEFILNLENPEKYEIAETFISKGLNINSINHYSDKDITPLHAAVFYNDLERVKFLIEHGANTKIQSNSYGMTALELAYKLHKTHIKEDRSEIIKILSTSANSI